MVELDLGVETRAGQLPTVWLALKGTLVCNVEKGCEYCYVTQICVVLSRRSRAGLSEVAQSWWQLAPDDSCTVT